MLLLREFMLVVSFLLHWMRVDVSFLVLFNEVISPRGVSLSERYFGQLLLCIFPLVVSLCLLRQVRHLVPHVVHQMPGLPLLVLAILGFNYGLNDSKDLLLVFHIILHREIYNW